MKASLQPTKLFGSATASSATAQQQGLKTMADNRPVSFQQSIQKIASTNQRVTKGVVIQRLLSHAQEKAAELKLPIPQTKEELIAYLKEQPKPEAGKGVDALRVAFNLKGSTQADRITYDFIWPEVNPIKEKAEAQVKKFLASIDSDAIKDSDLFKRLAPLIQQSGGELRGNSGSNLLYKFVVYHMHGKQLLDEVTDEYSDDYKNALNAELSDKVKLYPAGAGNDEVFKHLPEQSSGAAIKEFRKELGDDTFLEPFSRGYVNLIDSLKEGDDLEKIVGHYFIHDKGYLNAATKRPS